MKPINILLLPALVGMGLVRSQAEDELRAGAYVQEITPPFESLIINSVLVDERPGPSLDHRLHYRGTLWLHPGSQPVCRPDLLKLFRLSQ